MSQQQVGFIDLTGTYAVGFGWVWVDSLSLFVMAPVEFTENTKVLKGFPSFKGCSIRGINCELHHLLGDFSDLF